MSSPNKSSNSIPSGSKLPAQSLLESVLSQRESSSSSSSRKRKREEKTPIHLLTNAISQDHKSRVEAKRIQLHNPDRPRPKNDPNDVKEIKRRARDERIRKKEKETLQSDPPPTKGKGKGKIDVKELQVLKKIDTKNYGKGKRKRKLTFDATDQQREDARRSGAKLPLSRKEKLSRGLMGKDKDLR